VSGRRLLVERVCVEGWPVVRAAGAQGCCGATARKWVARYQAEGDAGLVDRSSRPRRSPARLSAARQDAIVAYRNSHRVGTHLIAAALGEAQSTVSVVLARRGAPLTRPREPLRYHAGARRAVLVAYGITTTGQPVFLGLDGASTESFDACLEFLRGLVARGPRGGVRGSV